MGMDVDAERALVAKGSMHNDGKRYLGVRVKMPVKDMLRNIRLAKGWDLQDLKENSGKRGPLSLIPICKISSVITSLWSKPMGSPQSLPKHSGEKKRVKTSGERRTSKRKQPTKSLEELAIIVEVLEEDLRTSSIYSPQPHNSPNPPVSPSCSLESADTPWGFEPHLYTNSIKYEAEMPRMTSYNLTDVNSPSDEHNNSCYLDLQVTSLSHQGTGCSSDESEDMVPSPDSYQALSPCEPLYASCDLQQDGHLERENLKEEWLDPQSPKWNQDSTVFFWTQLQREESQLRDLPDSLLLSTDVNGRTALHRVVCLGKRAQGYVIAKRMAALNSLDLKDGEGMTALHLASKQNQHLMVGDLIHLGASINERDGSGKTCLHLSAENGYIRVLEPLHKPASSSKLGQVLRHVLQAKVESEEVLKRMMQDGVYVDVEATDNSGLSVLQCAALAQNMIVHDLERSSCPSQHRLLTLRKEQMMETLECLLHMGSYLHTPGNYAA